MSQKPPTEPATEPESPAPPSAPPPSTYARPAGPRPHPRGLKVYHQVREDTTPADQALLMLLEGARRFVEEALVHLAAREFEAKNEKLIKAQKIVSVLSNSLGEEIGEPAYSHIQSLYFFIYRHLVEGNLTDDAGLLEVGREVLDEVTSMWTETVQRFHAEQKAAKSAPEPAAEKPAPEAPRLGEGICLQG